jgi:creatinine amidohydrolase
MTSFESLHAENVNVAASRSVLILPVGSVEQHGPHLPLNVDIQIPSRVATAVAERVEATVAPAIPYGARTLPQSGGAPTIAGTVFVRGAVLTEYLKDVIEGYVANGFRFLVVLNGHYENESFIFEALELCRREGKLDGVKAIAVSWWSLVSDATLREQFGDQFPGWHAEHASACETSLMLHLRGELVGPTRVDNPTPPRAGIYFYPVEPAIVSNRGVLGRTTLATAQSGEALFKEICSGLVALIREQMKIPQKT